MRKILVIVVFILFAMQATDLHAQEPTDTPLPTPRPDITQTTEEVVEPLGRLLDSQTLGPIFPFNPVKYALRASVEAGVPPTTLVLLLLLPFIAAFIAAARHIVGLRGYGIFLPAALSVVFVATGPVVGLLLFAMIIFSSVAIRIFLRKAHVKLQYLPRMALTLWFVVLGVLMVLLSAPLTKIPGLTNVSIFPVLILVLLAEDFSKIQIGKSIRVATGRAMETIMLSLISYIFLTTQVLREFTLLNPEILLIGVAIFNLLLGRYSGLRLAEYWRFRRLMSN